jgi:molecular chaperone GrpE (heat shock protein)
MDITDLVKSQKKVEEKQEEYFNNLFQHLDNLETKLGEMDGIMTKLNDLEAKVEKYREKTPQERLELRTLDSGPFNQKLSQFFDDKEEDMEKTGKNEYVLTQDEVEDYSPNEIKKTFRNFEDEVNPFRQVR